MRVINKIGIVIGTLMFLLAPTVVYGETEAKIGTRGIVEVNSTLNVRKGPGIEFEILANLENQSICRVTVIDGDWAYMNCGETAGYVSMNYVRLLGRNETETQMDRTNETEEESVAIESNDAGEESVVTETAEILTDVQEDVEQETQETIATPDAMRQDMVNFALQYVGNPYVWGGTSLTEGADCSGFVQSIYAEYGITLPRTSGEQAYAGEQIDLAEALPGDLIFYADENGNIYHVVMYMGDGKVVQAASTAAGIITSDVNYEKAVWAERFF